MSRARAFFASMSGRIFVLLALGMATAAWLATAITNARSEREFREQLAERATDRLEGYVAFLDAMPNSLREVLLSSGGIAGIRVQPATVTGSGADTAFQTALTRRGGVLGAAKAQSAALPVCFPELRNFTREDIQRALASEDVQRALARSPLRNRLRPPNTNSIVPPVCRLINLSLSDGTPLHLSIDTPWVERERNRLLDPAFLALLALALGILAYVVARIAGAPLNHMSSAAAELGQDLDRAPLEVSGPAEVRSAAEAFNAMQRRLQQHVGERTNMLAAITHDLQTPLTRLRLRIERVEDEELRARLVGDLAAMKALIDEGLELARSAETSEPRVQLDLDSLLESLVEDAADAGGEAVFERGCGAVLRIRPLAARRLFSNLIDNALKYGGTAIVSSERAGEEVSVRIRDRGPGLPEDMLERVFDPFVRIDNSRSRQTGGAGLGLTIARTLAEKNGATLTLRNHPEGGLEAIVHWPGTRPAA